VPQKPPEFERLIQAFNREGVRYVVIGGMAMVLHGSDHATVDVDFAVAADAENTDPLVRALTPLHPRPKNRLLVPEFPWDARSIFGAQVNLETDAGDIDLLRIYPGVDSFEGLLARSVRRVIFDIPVQVASIPDLVAMKTEAGRPKDKIHLLELESLANLEQPSKE